MLAIIIASTISSGRLAATDLFPIQGVGDSPGLPSYGFELKAGSGDSYYSP
ncbi:hypothetical protein METHB2_60040 [Candidatus Methylobacter favarea]|uniref:Uncharacterized protein n=1 Tax=Candidatus Methylobacter favarea TaxID=2707345 RepID=A0A8S0XTY5_9GAMM|nr:hypothetical protein METHB2_60040 [Candidatus Methylobacter favarea]